MDNISTALSEYLSVIFDDSSIFIKNIQVVIDVSPKKTGGKER
jgi:hypothetical protein